MTRYIGLLRGAPSISNVVITSSAPPSELPAWISSTILEVGSGKAYADITAALVDHQPRDQIVVYPGTYPKFDLTAVRSKVCVRSATDVRNLADGLSPDVVLTNSDLMTVDGTDVFLSGFDFGNRRMDIRADNATLMRYVKRNEMYVYGSYPRIGYAAHSDWRDQGCRFLPNTANGWKFYRMWLHDADCYGQVGEALSCGSSAKHDLDESLGVADIVRIERVGYFTDPSNPSGSVNNEVVSVKSSRVKIRRVHLLGGATKYGNATKQINNRHGKNNLYEAIYVEGAGVIIAGRGSNNVYVNCDVASAIGGEVQVSRGNVDTATWDQIVAGLAPESSKYVMSENVNFYGTIGAVNTGFPGPIEPKNCVVHGPEAGRTYPAPLITRNDPPYPSGMIAAVIPLSSVGFRAPFDGWPEY